mgnify:CR=1 FL=1
MGESLNAAHDNATRSGARPGRRPARQQCMRGGGVALRRAGTRTAQLQSSSRTCWVIRWRKSARWLELSLPAVKAALHWRSAAAARNCRCGSRAEPPRADLSPRRGALRGLVQRSGPGRRARHLLAEAMRLNPVSRAQRAGAPCGDYTSNYER